MSPASQEFPTLIAKPRKRFPGPMIHGPLRGIYPPWNKSRLDVRFQDFTAASSDVRKRTVMRRNEITGMDLTQRVFACAAETIGLRQVEKKSGLFHFAHRYSTISPATDSAEEAASSIPLSCLLVNKKICSFNSVAAVPLAVHTFSTIPVSSY